MVPNELKLVFLGKNEKISDFSCSSFHMNPVFCNSLCSNDLILIKVWFFFQKGRNIQWKSHLQVIFNIKAPPLSAMIYYHHLQLLTLLFCLKVTQEIHFLLQFAYPILILYIAVTNIKPFFESTPTGDFKVLI